MAKSETEEEILLHKELAQEYVKRRSSEGSRLFEAHWNDEVLQALAPFGHETVLDCCCGDGILLPALVTAFKRVTGIDISEDMLALARQRPAAKHCELVEGDVEALPFDAQAFDAVTFRGAFHHIPDPARGLREVHRVLKPGGGIALFEPNGDPLLWRLFRKAYYTASPKFSSTHRFYRRRELCDLLTAAGLEPVTVRTLFFLAYPFAGLLDHFRVFRFVPFHASLTKVFLKIDRVLGRLPLVRNWGFALLVVGQKRE